MKAPIGRIHPGANMVAPGVLLDADFMSLALRRHQRIMLVLDRENPRPREGVATVIGVEGGHVYFDYSRITSAIPTAAPGDFIFREEDLMPAFVLVETGAAMPKHDAGVTRFHADHIASGFHEPWQIAEDDIARALFRVKMYDEIHRRAECSDGGAGPLVIRNANPEYARRVTHVEAIMWERCIAVRAECEEEAKAIVATMRAWA